MTSYDEIMELEERLRQAELGPDPTFFEETLHDDALLDGRRLKQAVVEAHRPGTGKGQKFTSVQMSDYEVVDYDNCAVVTCRGRYEGENGIFEIRFKRVWLKVDGRWQIIAACTLS